MLGVLAGFNWFGVDNGEPVIITRLKPLPPLMDDNELIPYFSGRGTSHKVWEMGKVGDPSPQFIIQHLCGYHFTPENYKREASKLEACGFECLRSRRGGDGKFWEFWVLGHPRFAQGPLKDFIIKNRLYERNGTVQGDYIRKWLCDKIQFGTLDITVQKAAMQPPEQNESLR